jgi:methionyl-tRNA formyltransferase
MTKPRIAVFGCKHTTIFLIEALRQSSQLAAVITISPAAALKAKVADYCDLTAMCAELNIPCYVANKYSLKDDQDLTQIASLKLDIAFVMGWQRMIPGDVLNTFAVGAFGMHGSTDDLPIGRGRSPMNWSLIERRTHFHTNLFRYDAGVDAGDILDSFVFSIQPSDTAETMHYKNVLAMKCLVLRNLEHLSSGNIRLHPQKASTPTFYPKRNPEDSIIDWRQDVFQIEAHIRAVTKPFNGAFTFANEDRVTIYRAAIFDTDVVDYGYRDRINGEVIEVFPSGKFLIRCRSGLLIVHEFSTTAKILAGLVLQSPAGKIAQFPTNIVGYHDLEETEVG